MARERLPDPRWTDAAEVCVACGYSLVGLASDGRCPECGAEYVARQLVVAGLPRGASGGSPWRRLGWGVVMVGASIQLYTWPLQLMHFPMLMTGATLALVGMLIAMLITGPRERQGAERFIIVPSGIARVALKATPDARRIDTIFIPWGLSDTVVLHRAGPMWRRLRIGRGGPESLCDVIFDAGIRCSDPDADELRTTLRRYLGQEPLLAERLPGSELELLDPSRPVFPKEP